MIFSGVTISQGVEFPIFLLIIAWALQQCSATAPPVINSCYNVWTVYKYVYSYCNALSVRFCAVDRALNSYIMIMIMIQVPGLRQAQQCGSQQNAGKSRSIVNLFCLTFCGVLLTFCITELDVAWYWLIGLFVGWLVGYVGGWIVWLIIDWLIDGWTGGWIDWWKYWLIVKTCNGRVVRHSLACIYSAKNGRWGTAPLYLKFSAIYSPPPQKRRLAVDILA